ncbi:DUF692 domain-containing protein [Streptomyces sp. PKU-MA01144]|uniref:DUF692 domain-containing protein n=1 Tax=Streptomyces TaxID=1883 RepID=UPI001479D72B|nr:MULTISPECIES: DUF692 domain-containing protein [Streptomyces]MCY0984485.1 DUF692 domain-containing protein [Streptomyces tirandamycinicus]NNJ04871.1 DUF692 domain-containing protein [Streptomyces sp. PKU-MA01144]
MLSGLPCLGSGLGYRPELAAAIGDHSDRIDWLEVITEHYLFEPGDQRETLLDLRRRFPIVPHGVELSLGAPEETDGRYLDALAQLVADVGAPWFSDHLSFTRAGDVALGTLVPLPRAREVAREVGHRAQAAQDAVGVPLLLENITYYLDLPAPLTEAQFITEVMEHCECGLLLDLTNLDVNARNHGYSPEEFLDSIPLERVVQVHLAGGEDDPAGAMALDTHAAPVPEQVWTLLSELVKRAPVRTTLLERDALFPEDFAELQADLDRARAVLLGAPGTRAGVV